MITFILGFLWCQIISHFGASILLHRYYCHKQIHWDDNLILKTIDLSSYKMYSKYKEYIIKCNIFAGNRIIIDVEI